MRAYLGVTRNFSVTHNEEREDLFIECVGCKTTKRIVDFYPQETRPPRCASINIARLTEFIGNFQMEHSGCPK